MVEVLGWGLGAAVLGVLGFNVLTALLAFGEFVGAGHTRDDWLVSPQALSPPEPSQQPSVILVHGFTGSPFDMRPLAEALWRAGFRVLAPVTPEQTRTTLAYRRGWASAQALSDWLAGIVEGETRVSGRRPVLVGFSMGGALSTVVAAQGGVEKLVLLAPYFGMARAPGVWPGGARLLARLIPVLPKPIRGNINDKQGYRAYTPGSFLISVAAFNRLGELVGAALRAVPKLSSPTLVVVAPKDGVASFHTLTHLFQDRPDTEFVTAPRSNHVLLYDYDRDQVITTVVRFLSR
jgi:carboxylesterase